MLLLQQQPLGLTAPARAHSLPPQPHQAVVCPQEPAWRVYAPTYAAGQSS